MDNTGQTCNFCLPPPVSRWRAALALTFFGALTTISNAPASADQALEERAYTHFIVTIAGPSAVKKGDKILIGVALTNQTPYSIIVPALLGSALLDNRFDVVGPHGRPRTVDSVNEATRNTQSFIQQVVDPGETFVQRTILSEIYDMTDAGEYSIVVRRLLSDGTQIISNRITVSVTK